MRIRLNNIGIVHDSTIDMAGLTIITGKNNSGKTTVGKALYSLLDAVSNLSKKARRDRERYIINQLDNVAEAMDLFRFFSRARDFENFVALENVAEKYPMLMLLLAGDYVHEIPQHEIEDFARKVHLELNKVDVEELSNISLIQFYAQRFLQKQEDQIDTAKMLSEQVNKGILILEELFAALEKDSQLVEYARESINQTLNVEFSGQIQPALFDVDASKIEIYEEDTCCFDVDIKNNTVVKNGNPVFGTSPYQKTFFIDNPFLLDNIPMARRMLRNPFGVDASCLINSNNIVPHSNKLAFILRADSQPSVLEQTIIDSSLETVKEKINSIVPGTFEFSTGGDYYVQNGKKLKMANLATGSKMFSIIKILLEKGHLGKSTMLILDEPEAHLHPKWQNRFAEMIVLLVKELDVNILLTTHSPNFVLALDAYMRKYSIEGKTNFYRTEFNEDNMVDYVCVNEDIGSIYHDFLEYLSEVKMLRNECMRNYDD